MKGYTIQNSINLLEKGANGSGESTTASNVSYDNTDSGLTAENVQAAIDEVVGDIPTISDYGVNYSETETVIGTYLGETLYRKVFTGLSVALNGNSWVDIPAAGLKELINVKAYAIVSDVLTTCALSESRYYATTENIQVATFPTGYNRTINILVAEYTKPAPANNTRKKKSKKED